MQIAKICCLKLLLDRGQLLIEIFCVRVFLCQNKDHALFGCQLNYCVKKTKQVNSYFPHSITSCEFVN
jgi:hypothetical protein